MMLRETILKKGSQEVKAKDSVTRNIATVCKTIGLMFSRCIGPNGMNILISDEKGDTFYAHDAFTALSAIRNTMSHPIARLIHEAVKSIDDNVGDGGKTFCILLGEAFKHAEKLREDGVKTANIISGYSEAANRCLQVLENATVRNVESAIPKLVETVLSRLPLSSDERKALSTLVLEAIEHATKSGRDVLDIKSVYVKNKLGADVTSSFLVKGIVVDKVWPGHMQMPQYIDRPKIALLTSSIELKRSTLKYEYTVTARDVQHLKQVIDGVSELYAEACRRLREVGATVVLARGELRDQVLEGLARCGIMSAFRFNWEDVEFIARATGARPVHDYKNIGPEDLGEAESARQVKIGGERWIVIDGCKSSAACTIVLRASSFKALKMYERAVVKTLKVVSSFMREPRLVPGGGAAEMFMATQLRFWSSNLDGQKGLAVQAFADSLEKIPFLLAVNSGRDGVESLASLRSNHLDGRIHYGIGPDGRAADMMMLGVLEPFHVKRALLDTLRETLVQLLRIENVIIARQIRGNVSTR
ncbi:MAG: TCP-1/cpn60 chaperonin family protein [Nitrososphaerota archaeon]